MPPIHRLIITLIYHHTSPPLLNTIPLSLCSLPLPLQNLLQLTPLLLSKRRRELYAIPNNKVSSSTTLLRHAKFRIRVLRSGLCWPSLINDKVLAIYGCDCTFPSSQRLFELEVDGLNDVVALACEEWVFFLLRSLAYCLPRYLGQIHRRLPLRPRSVGPVFRHLLPRQHSET